MDPQEYKIYQTGKAQGKSDDFIKGAILAYRATKPNPVNHLDGFSAIDQTPAKTTGSAGQTIVPGSTLKDNLKALPGQLLSAGKGLFNAFTGSEQAVGGEIAAGLPKTITGEADLNKANQSNASSDIAFIKAINAKKAAGQKLTTAQQELYDHILQTNSSVGTQTDLLPHAADTNTEALLNVGGVALDALASGGASKGAELAKTAKTALTSTAEELAAKESTKIAETLTPKLTATPYKKAGLAGKLDSPSWFKAAGLATDAPEIQKAVTAVKNVATALGKKTTDIIKPTLSSATENINRVGAAISDYSEKVVSPFLSANKVPTHFADYIDYLKQVKPDEAIRANGDALTTFNRVRERVIKEVYSSLKSQSKDAGEFGSVTDPNIYWNARKRIDSIITEELGAKALTDTGRTGVQAAAKSLRQGTADFISDMLRFPGQTENVAKLREAVNTLHSKGFELDPEHVDALARQIGLNPTGAKVASEWEAHMKNLRGLYAAETNLSTKVTGEQGKNLIQIAAKNHPIIAKGIRYGAGAVGAGLLFKEGESLAGD